MKKDMPLPPVSFAEQEPYMQTMREKNDLLAAETGKRRKAFVITFGCQQNEADSEKLMGMCLAMGYEKAESEGDADLILINTCAIREHAEKKALSIVGECKHLKAKNPALTVGVCGCMVAQEHRKESMKRSYPYVDFVFGPSSIHRLPSILCHRLYPKRESKRFFCPEEQTFTAPEGLPIHRESGYRAWVSVMYGCNNFCSYCIVPYVRGRERSRQPEEIIKEVRSLVAEGYRDITLLGQNVNSFGKDKGDGFDFADLLSEIDKIEGDYLVRFMTSHPKDASFKLIDVMASSKHIAHQFHLPMQSGSDEVLKAMNRRYDRAKYLGIVEYMRKKMPDVTITSDIIVGFPGETEENFCGTLEMLKKAQFDMIYSFIYSPRKGTPAAEWEQIPMEIKNARYDRLIALQNEIAQKKNDRLVGKSLRVLCDGESKNNPELYAGRTEGNVIVFFEGTPEDKGKYVNVTVSRAEPFALYGEKTK